MLFDVALAGSYYRRIITEMQTTGRLPEYPTTLQRRYILLGIWASDSTVIYYWQTVGKSCISLTAPKVVDTH